MANEKQSYLCHFFVCVHYKIEPYEIMFLNYQLIKVNHPKEQKIIRKINQGPNIQESDAPMNIF